MSDEYTPTTKQVRHDYAYNWNTESVDADFVARFDRWLAAHDAAARTAALEEAAVIAEKTISYQYMVTSSGHISAARAIRFAKVADS